MLGLTLSFGNYVHVHFQRKHNSNSPIQIQVLTESLCPDCQAFILSSYADAIAAQGLDQFVNVTIIPFGNAREVQAGDKWNFTCQHGENECVGNVVENCLFAHVAKSDAQRVLVCLEQKIQSNRNWTEVLKACGEEEKTDVADVLNCANSNEGNKLTHQAALNTDPNHQYVPWVVVNGNHDTNAENQILDNLIAYVCSQAPDSKSIPACQNKTLLSRRSNTHHRSQRVEVDQRVNITVLTESLCPYCQNFIVTSFADAVNTTDIEKIANFNVLPFGNARTQKDGDNYTFTCQHGERECDGNAVELCALAHLDELTAKKVIVCIENKVFNGDIYTIIIDQCEAEVGVCLNTTRTCYFGPEGHQLMINASQQTDPKHQYVPWVVVDGQHDTNAENQVLDNLVKYVCENYKGPVKIAACQTEHRLARSYADEF